MNNQLNVFAVNFAAVYGGFNDVKTQIGYNMDKGSQTDITEVFVIDTLCTIFYFKTI